MPFKSRAQPRCRYCGTPIRKHVRTVWFVRPDQGGSDSDFVRYVRLAPGEWPKTLAECQRLTNWKVVSVRRGMGETISRFGEWDGESWSDEFFCNGGHAARMGYLLCRQYGYGTDKWRKATGA